MVGKSKHNNCFLWMYLRITLKVPEQSWVAEGQVAGGEEGLRSYQSLAGTRCLSPAACFATSFPHLFSYSQSLQSHFNPFGSILYILTLCPTCVVLSGSLSGACAILVPKWALLLPSTPCSCMTQDAGAIWVSNIYGKIALGVLFFTTVISFVCLTNTGTYLNWNGSN